MRQSQRDKDPVQRAIKVFRQGRRYLLLLGLIPLYYMHWGSALVFGIMLVSALLAWRKYGQDAVLAYGRRNWKWLALVAILAPVTLPPLFQAYSWALRKDWGEVVTKPQVAYIWNVDASKFSKEDRKRLAKLNPGGEENEELRNLILAAARKVGLGVTGVEPYSVSAMHDRAEIIIIFESIELAAPPPLEMEEEQVQEDEAEEKEEVTQAVIKLTYLAPDMRQKAMTKKESEELEQASSAEDFLKSGRYKSYDHPIPSLQLTFDSLVQGFGNAAGVNVDLDRVDPAGLLPAEKG